MLEIDPNLPETHANMGIALAEMQQFADAETSLRQAIRLRPNYPEAINNLGMVLSERGNIDEAIALYQQVCNLQPGSHESQNNLANALLAHGKVDEALAVYRSLLSSPQPAPLIHSNYLFALNYDPHISVDQLAAEHRRWAEAHADQLSIDSPHFTQSPDPDRRLRIGYHGSFFPDNPATTFMLAPLANRNRQQFEVILYDDNRRPGTSNDSTAGLADRIIKTGGMNNSDFAQKVRDDQVDILIDLFGHIGEHRLQAFAIHLAPVQITYLGYCNTTGMRSIDYLITDEICDPREYDSRYVEKLIRLPGGFCCFSPPPDSPPPNASPALQRDGQITFGSFHTLAKINRDVIRVWAALLRQVPRSRLFIVRNTLTGSAITRLQQWFTEENINPDRIELRSQLPAAGHWALYHEIDISLDVWPWSGHTTACESLWMGVPIITQLGNTHAGRMVASVLTHCGRSEWIAKDEHAYIEIAQKLSEDATSLAKLRSRLREEFAASPLCDGQHFAGELESAFRNAWQTWCEQQHK
ncbi:MAG TPA: tetratricopeptide repeat protein, partial [Tepidisphaeraceae bacterium]|nr:tetratricopeptide repeat protein [Tepidisphaeraceae bacterium]